MQQSIQLGTKRNTGRVFRVLIELSLLVLLSPGCSMSLPQHKLLTLGPLPDRSTGADRPSAFLDVKFLADLSGGERPPFEHPPATAKFRELVDKVTKESGLFSQFSFEIRDADYQIRMEMLDYGSAGAAVAAGFLSGATLGIIPGAVTDNYRLTVTVADRSGETLKTYEFEDAVDSWIGIWFAPAFASQPEHVVPAVFENMVRHAYRGIYDDRLLEDRSE